MPRTRLLIALAATLALTAPAQASFVPNDPGLGSSSGGWARDQWNFTGPYGVDALGAWRHLIAKGRPGGRGVVVAVVDSGIAYRDRPPFVRSPELEKARFVRGYDFVDEDPYADDQTGHGTHVASTIAETTNNARGLTGLAYGARLMPIRVLDARNEGSSIDIARGIHWAAAHGADVINVSIELSETVVKSDVPDMVSAIAYARQEGAVVVAAAGNTGAERIAIPARLPFVVSVGSTTEHGCLSSFSDVGNDLDLVAPGGGSDADFGDDPRCRPEDDTLRDIYQVTLDAQTPGRFVVPDRFEGTSAAAPHVSAAAALLIASGTLGLAPPPVQVEQRLEATAMDLGVPGRDRRYGSGLLDAAGAVRAGPAVRRPTPSG